MDKIASILTFLKDSPKDEFLRHALGLEYIKAGDDLKARILFEELLTDNPLYVGTYYHLAKLLEKMERTDLAIEWYEKGMAIAKQLKDNHAYNELQAAYEDLVY